jgi:hypothetical protein
MQVEARLLGRSGHKVAQHRPAEQLDEGAVLLRGLDAVGDLHKLPRGRFRIRIGAGSTNLFMRLLDVRRGCDRQRSRS